MVYHPGMSGSLCCPRVPPCPGRRPREGGQGGGHAELWMRILPLCPSRGCLCALLVVLPVTATAGLGLLAVRGGTGTRLFTRSLFVRRDPVEIQGSRVRKAGGGTR